MTTTARRSSSRMRRHRARQRAGRLVLAVEVDEVGLVELLIETGRLSRDRSEDRKAITDATTKLLASLTVAHVD